MTDHCQEFKAGEKVPATGIYDVIHDRLDGDEHAQAHQVLAIAGTVFLPCRGCRTSVTFRFHAGLEHLESHHHFQSPTQRNSQCT